MAGHGHSHGGSCEHEHDKVDSLGDAYSLYLKIDLEKVQCLNEAIEGSGKYVFKPWDKRLDKDKFVESDADEELLFNIQFTGSVKLKGMIVIGENDDMHPSRMKLYKNRPHMTFDDTGAMPDQEIELHRDPTGSLEYTIKVARFNNVNQLSIYFPSNFGAEQTRIYYIGLRGEFFQAAKEGVVVVNYELAPNPADHKTNLMDNVRHEIQ